jgi:hypothetical protein
MKTGTITIEVDYDDSGDPVCVRVAGEVSGAGQLTAAGALIASASEGSGVTIRSGVHLMAIKLGWDWLKEAIEEAAFAEGE